MEIRRDNHQMLKRNLARMKWMEPLSLTTIHLMKRKPMKGDLIVTPATLLEPVMVINNPTTYHARVNEP